MVLSTADVKRLLRIAQLLTDRARLFVKRVMRAFTLLAKQLRYLFLHLWRKVVASSDLLAQSRSENIAEARQHLISAQSELASAQALAGRGEAKAAFAAVDAGFGELRCARLLVQAPEHDPETD